MKAAKHDSLQHTKESICKETRDMMRGWPSGRVAFSRCEFAV